MYSSRRSSWLSDRQLARGGRSRYAAGPWRLRGSDAPGQFSTDKVPGPRSTILLDGSGRGETYPYTYTLTPHHAASERSFRSVLPSDRGGSCGPDGWLGQLSLSPCAKRKGGFVGAGPAAKMQQPRRMQAQPAGWALLAVGTSIPRSSRMTVLPWASVGNIPKCQTQALTSNKTLNAEKRSATSVMTFYKHPLRDGGSRLDGRK
jgi:hypothetical protein